ncbi:MAG: septal ring lytic transglycosylase RlpA family protein [Candidatus Acidiferrales bacterium]
MPELSEFNLQNRTARLPPFRLFALFLLTLGAVGCSARRPITTTVPPAPQPASEPGAPAAPVSRPSPNPSPAASAAAPATRSSPFIPGVYVQEGTASWYGVPFNGRRAADGEIFDMNSFVAAHRTLPFGSILRVTNLNNGREVQVRVIDRGPFVGDRILDLARAAAASLGMIGSGTAPVRIELLSEPGSPAGEYTVQIGAFADRTNADRLRQRLLPKYHPIFIQDYDAPDGHFYRVRVGAVATEDAAQQLAQRLQANGGFVTFVMRLDQAADLGAK